MLPGVEHSRAMTPERATKLPPGIYGTDAVDVAYEPWRAVRATALRVGPSSRAPVVLSDAGEPVGLAAGGHLGRQSTRNPSCSDSPPLRPAEGGFVWGYCMPPATRKSGWMRLADLVRDPAYDELACGPAGEDFDPRDPEGCGGHCDGRPPTGVAPASGTAAVEVREAYLRYAPGSTAFRYLVRGDTVRRLVRAEQGRWTAVEVRSARWAGAGTRGWVIASALASAG